jgi:hypothetical protein
MVGEIARPHQGNAFKPCPLRQMFDIHLPAGGAGIFRVNMKVGNKFHFSLLGLLSYWVIELLGY